ncbi:MAG: 2-oxoacid:acceptor oxidoreductase subunit alpha [SAR324 cluster bacterium]|nr:2-oxoacid:acceptor oxidoreductase subunit alpha [SAR324 cluster bacterium]
MDGAVVNDLNICVATTNGSGSQSSNTVLYKSLYKMGIPCSGKNLFPSNIQGLPTWYYIRASGEGYLARKDDIDVMVIFNEATAAEDVEKVREGGLVIYDDSGPLPEELKRPQLQYLGVPAWNLVKEHIKSPQLRAKQRNMIYVGALAQLFGIPLEVTKEVLTDVFGSKPAVVDANYLCIELGYKHMEASGASQDIARLEAMPGGNDNKIMTEGNTAAALGAIFGGATVVAWYPITPSSSLVEEMIARIHKYRTDEHGRHRYAIVQAEDELASVAMVVGAGWAGARAMTSTAGPGLSLMQEGIGLAYIAEVPGVFMIVQRGGPSTGLPTRTQQADITLMHQGSHGDTRHIVLIPHDNASVFDMSCRSFDFADQFQTPVFLMLDLDLGMNQALSEPFKMPAEPIQRGKLLDKEALEALEAQGGKFRRYFDVDGDGIPQRTIPGTDHPGASYFARGSGHNEDAVYSENSEVYKKLQDRLRKKYETARSAVPKPLIENSTGAKEGLISFGSSYEPVREARDRLSASGRLTDHLLLRALPLTEEVREFIAHHDIVYLIEQNRDGQMTQIVRDDYPDLAARVQSICIYDGMPLAAGEIVQLINGAK